MKNHLSVISVIIIFGILITTATSADDAKRVQKFNLNDTGTILFGEYPLGNAPSCISIPTVSTPQDCHQGRDSSHYDDSDGHAGFSYTKLDSNGELLDVSATNWTCVLDNVTGLVWEVKNNDGGIHDWDNTYRWGGITHQGNFGTDFYSDWDTLVDNSNSDDFCGFSDWRVPTVQELRSIVNLGAFNPTIDTNYFPKTKNSIYWTSTPGSEIENNAWHISFFYWSSSSISFRGDSKYVRLVR